MLLQGRNCSSLLEDDKQHLGHLLSEERVDTMLWKRHGQPSLDDHFLSLFRYTKWTAISTNAWCQGYVKLSDSAPTWKPFLARCNLKLDIIWRKLHPMLMHFINIYISRGY